MLCKYCGSFGVAAALLIGAFVANSHASEKAKSAAVIGQTAPAFTLMDQDGKATSLADFSGKVVVLEWFNNECPFVKKHYSAGDMNKLAKKYTDQGVIWLAVNSTKGNSVASNKSVAGDWKIERPILSDAEGTVGHAYDARTTPHMFIVNKDGTLVYAGAIDDNSSPDQEDIAKSKNYVAAALDEVLAGKPVSTPETKSYGCGVKYAK